MKQIDIKDLVYGVLTLIGFSISIGQFPALRAFATREMRKTMTMESPFKPFRFPDGYEVKKNRIDHRLEINLRRQLPK